jgi:hypothetical protein
MTCGAEPPCMRQTVVPVIAFDLQRAPLLVLALQIKP